MFEVGDDSVFTDFEQAELTTPSPRKQDADGRTICVSRELDMPETLGAPVLCDFGSAVLGTEPHVEDVQPDVYRAPEVILEKPWSYSIDIWNVGCMVSQFPLLKLFTVRLLEAYGDISLHRSGTSTKGAISSPGMIRNSRPTVVGPISRR